MTHRATSSPPPKFQQDALVGGGVGASLGGGGVGASLAGTNKNIVVGRAAGTNNNFVEIGTNKDIVVGRVAGTHNNFVELGIHKDVVVDVGGGILDWEEENGFD